MCLLKVYGPPGPPVNSSQDKAAVVSLEADLAWIQYMPTGVIDGQSLRLWWFVRTYPILPGPTVALVVGALDIPFCVKAASAKAVGFVAWYKSTCNVGDSVRVVIASLHIKEQIPQIIYWVLGQWFIYSWSLSLFYHKRYTDKWKITGKIPRQITSLGSV